MKPVELQKRRRNNRRKTENENLFSREEIGGMLHENRREWKNAVGSIKQNSNKRDKGREKRDDEKDVMHEEELKSGRRTESSGSDCPRGNVTGCGARRSTIQPIRECN
ncbi:hypothetical protein K0M31_002843 [Melipona bicolor]|uniref:Uncharacterized protein n=1 Tax=Melipona bicolor TaxID=60889 RepID=A0AA40G0F0_9HYME|nr:hypothetical protein K0M31_002843 [Melipona bicolor]